MKKTVIHTWWLRRRTGGVPLRRNPLCRKSDRLQQISAWAWFVAALLTIPVVSIAVVPAIVDSWQLPTMAPTTAVMEHVAEAPVVVGSSPAVDFHRMYAVQVHWITSTGFVRRESVRVVAAPRRGSKIRIWATASGDRVTAARPRGSRALDTSMLIINAAVDVCLAAYGAHRLLRWQLDRRRLRAWDAELGKLLTRR